MGVDALLTQVRDLSAKVQSDPEKYQAALAKSEAAVKSISVFLAKLRAGDKAGVVAQLTEWDDVNRTLQAVADVKSVNDNPGVELDDVLGVVSIVGKVVFALVKAGL